jgi:hypothetical protein
MAAEETGAMWLRMLGLGDIMRELKNPDNITRAMMLIQVSTEAMQALPRMEAKLNLLLRERGHDPQQFDRQWAEFQSARTGGFGPIVLEQQRTAGTGGHPASSGAPDDGGQTASQHLGAKR